MNRFCQSCSLPLKQNSGGTNADGSISTEYCNLCYQKGEFLQKDLTAQQMHEFCVETLSAQGIPKLKAWIMTRNIPKMRRWNPPSDK